MCDWLNGPLFSGDDSMCIPVAIIRASLAHRYLAWVHPGGSFQIAGEGGGETVNPAHTAVCVMLVCMTQVDRLSVTMAPEIGAAVREAAAREGTSVSTWLTLAAAQRLRNDLLGVALDLWEAEDGPFSDEELNTAAAALSATRRRGAA